MAAADGGADRLPRQFKAKVEGIGSNPLVIAEEVPVDPGEVPPDFERYRPIARTLKEYRRAAGALLGGKYSHLAEAAPAHMREPCVPWVILCDDGVVVRWDRTAEEDPKVRMVYEWEGEAPTVASAAPKFSQGVVYAAPDPSAFAPPADGPRIQMSIHEAVTGHVRPVVVGRIAFVVPWPITGGAAGTHGARPVAAISVANEFTLNMVGEMFDERADAVAGNGQRFITTGRFELPVGWRVFEVYPQTDPTRWQPEMAASWAELDLLAVAASRNVLDRQLQQIDPNAAARKRIAALLQEAEALLNGREAPVQVFLQQHPELIQPSYRRVWPKLPFGRRVTDFVLQEQSGEYLLVEIEAPTRRLFTQEGQPHNELVHAVDQVTDWRRYIEDNLATVQRELGLAGISTGPNALVVIGRSGDLRPEDRRKLITMNNESPKTRILTYDDLFANARAVAENLLGTLWNIQGDAQVYYLPAES